jgi:hypothetical protein
MSYCRPLRAGVDGNKQIHAMNDFNNDGRTKRWRPIAEGAPERCRHIGDHGYTLNLRTS